MRKQLFSILLALCMVLYLVPTTAFAEGAAEESPVCTCETACTVESMDVACPVCGVEGALPENCGMCSEPVNDAEPKCEESEEQPNEESFEAQPDAIPMVLSGETLIRSESELNTALNDETRTEIKLGENIEFSGCFIISHTVTLDLNGYTLTSSGTNFNMFNVYYNGNLTIKDSGTGGKIDGQNRSCGFAIYGGTLTLESGTIINCTDEDGDGGAVDISSGGSGEVNIYGKFVMNGGAITNCKAGDDGGAVDIGKGCTFIMNGGTISGCRAYDDAGAIFVKQKSSFVMNGGTIENCSANRGGAVNIYRDGSFSMTGGTIKDCTVDEGGSGNAIYGESDAAIIAISGGSIENCGTSPLSFDIFTVSFDSDGGTPVKEQKVRNVPAVKPADPEKAGYIFKGWYVGETQFDFSVSINENTIVMAKWLKCDHAGNSAQPTCTDSAVCSICKGTIPAKGHVLSWQSENGQYWQTCGNCNFETVKKSIPAIAINGADKVCRTQDYTFGITLPDGCKLITTSYEFEKLGGDLSATLENGYYMVELGSSSYPAEENVFKVMVSAETADGFAIKSEKSVTILNSHTGGKATCKYKAICDICREPYGELNPNNHSDLVHHDAQAATAAELGNIEYWHCNGCDKYFSDEAGTKNIKETDTIIAKLAPSIIAGDGATAMQGEKKNLSFTSNAAFADFIRVELDSKTLDEKSYTVKAGSTVVTLNADYVATLSAGEHTLSIISQSGTATAKFTVNAKTVNINSSKNSPQTGDTSNLALLIALLFVSSGAAIGTTVVSGRKKHNN